MEDSNQTKFPEAARTLSVLFNHTPFIQGELQYFLSEFENSIRYDEINHIIQSEQAIIFATNQHGQLAEGEEEGEGKTTPQKYIDILNTLLKSTNSQHESHCQRRTIFERQWESAKERRDKLRPPLLAKVALDLEEAKKKEDAEYEHSLLALDQWYSKRKASLNQMTDI